MGLRAPRLGVVLASAWLAAALPAAEARDTGGTQEGCRLVRGRLAVWNGNPAVRIWPVGTRRMLGVADAHGDAAGDGLMPAPVKALIDAAPDRTVVFGDYKVCALTKQTPGHMQIVHIVSASRLRAEQR